MNSYKFRVGDQSGAEVEYDYTEYSTAVIVYNNSASPDKYMTYIGPRVEAKIKPTSRGFIMWDLEKDKQNFDVSIACVYNSRMEHDFATMRLVQFKNENSLSRSFTVFSPDIRQRFLRGRVFKDDSESYVELSNYKIGWNSGKAYVFNDSGDPDLITTLSALPESHDLALLTLLDYFMANPDKWQAKENKIRNGDRRDRKTDYARAVVNQ